MGATLGVATLQTDVDQSGVKKGLDASEKSSKSKLKQIGQALTTGFGVAFAQGITRIVGQALTGLFEGVKQTFKDLTRIQRISAQTAAVIESTGSAAGFTVGEIEDMAGALEDLTAQEAEAVQEGANMLLTFTNIGKEVFPDALAVINDMGVALGQDLSQVAIQVGKALNDPVLGISALTRVGVSFTEEQKAVINSLVETGEVAEAQKIILEELAKEFGGSGEAFAQTIEGQQALIDHQIGTIKETLLGTFLPLMGDAITGLNEFLRGPEVQAALDATVSFIENKVIPTVTSLLEVARLLMTGDFRGGIFGMAEDDEGIDKLFNFREGIISIVDFIKENWPTIQKALAGVVGIFAGSAIISVIGSIGAMLGTLLSPIGAVIAGVALLAAAWATDFGGIRTTITNWWNTTGRPIFEQLVAWLQVTIPAAIAAMSAWWIGTALPALSAFWSWVETNVFPIVEMLVNVWLASLGSQITAVAGFFQNVLLPAAAAVFEWLKTNALPVIMEIVTWLGENIPVALQAAADFFEGTLLPAIQAVGDWVSENLFPLFEALGTFLTEVFNVAWEALALALETRVLPLLDLIGQVIAVVWENLAEKLQPTLETVGTFLSEVFAVALEGVSSAIESMVGWLQDAAEWLGKLGDDLPDAFTPGSPMPFGIGLQDINEQLANMGERISPVTVGLAAASGIQVPEIAARPGAGLGGESETLILQVDTLIGNEAWLANLAKMIKPKLDRENIRTSAQGAGGLNQ